MMIINKNTYMISNCITIRCTTIIYDSIYPISISLVKQKYFVIHKYYLQTVLFRQIAWPPPLVTYAIDRAVTQRIDSTNRWPQLTTRQPAVCKLNAFLSIFQCHYINLIVEQSGSLQLYLKTQFYSDLCCASKTPLRCFHFSFGA